MRRVKIAHPITYDGVSYKPGQVWNLPDDLAARAIAAGYAADQPTGGTDTPAPADPLPQYLTRLDVAKAVMAIGAAVEGLSYYAYGASYSAGDFSNTGPSTRYPNRVARRLGLTVQNRAVSGSEMSDVYMMLHCSESTRVLTPGTKGIIDISAIENDMIRGGDSTDRRTGFKSGLKASIYRAFCKQVLAYNDAAITYTDGPGTVGQAWYNQSIPLGLGFTHTFKATYRTGGKASIALPAGRDYVVFSYLIEPALFNNSTGGKWSLTADGAPVLTDYAPPAMEASQANTPATGWAIPVLNLPQGTHTIVTENRGGTVNNGHIIDGVGIIDRAALPQVLITKPMYLDPARYPGANANNATIDLFRQYVDEVIDEIKAEAPWAASALTVVDPLRYGWDGPSMVGADNLHPNDRGEGQLAWAVASELAALPFRNGMTLGN